jgi:hypothetical protein
LACAGTSLYLTALDTHKRQPCPDGIRNNNLRQQAVTWIGISRPNDSLFSLEMLVFLSDIVKETDLINYLERELKEAVVALLEVPYHYMEGFMNATRKLNRNILRAVI